MADQSGVMTLARIDMAQLRLSGLILGALIERKLLQPQEAGALVRDVMPFLDDPTCDPGSVRAMQEAYRRLAADLEGSRR